MKKGRELKIKVFEKISKDNVLECYLLWQKVKSLSSQMENQLKAFSKKNGIVEGVGFYEKKQQTIVDVRGFIEEILNKLEEPEKEDIWSLLKLSVQDANFILHEHQDQLENLYAFKEKHIFKKTVLRFGRKENQSE